MESESSVPPPIHCTTSQQTNTAASNEQFTPSRSLARWLITDAEKIVDLGRPYVAYVILGEDGTTVRRRYSELARKYPYVVIPPIPAKHSLADIAAKQAKAKDDSKLIEYRKRQLQVFLNRVVSHPILGKEHLFHRFLEPGTWSDVVYSQANVSGHRPDAAMKTSAKTLIGTTRRPKTPDPKFAECEKYADTFGYISDILEKCARKLRNNFKDASTQYAELGSMFNAFSLHESERPDVARLIEGIGQAMDSSHVASTNMIDDLAVHFIEPIHEYIQFNDSVKHVLQNRLKRHLYFEDLGDTLESKRLQLFTLERSETAAIPVSERSGAVGKLVGSVTNAFQNMMDQDPESTRRANLAKLKDTIGHLEKSRDESKEQLGKAGEETQTYLDMFQKQKEVDLRYTLLQFAKVYQNYYRRNVEAWRDVGEMLDLAS